jgi:hypothetical protein
MLRFILPSSLACALLATPALAQVYKWVDDKGVVNYSSEAPAGRNSTLLDPKSARVSVYSTDEAPKRAPRPAAGVDVRTLSEKIDRLERKLDAERYARQGLADAQAQIASDAWYEQCLRDRRVDCDYGGMNPYYYPYGPIVVVLKPQLRQRSHVKGNVPKPVTRPSFAPRMGLSRQM